MEGQVDPKDVRAVAEALKHLRWSAGKLSPAEYGEQRHAPGPQVVVIKTDLWSEQPGDVQDATFTVVAPVGDGS